MSFSESSETLLEVDPKTKLLVRKWLPDQQIKTIFLAIHGGLAHCGDWVTPALYFKKKGYATLAFDLRYHGTYAKYNKGKVFGHIDSFDTYISDVQVFYESITKEYPNIPIFVLAHSLGALIALKYGLTKALSDKNIKGFVLSSPWLENKVKVSPVLVSMSSILAKIRPTFAIKPEPITDHLTHDEQIYKRHLADEQAGLRGIKVSAKFGQESFKTQKWVLNNIDQWTTFPLFAVISGDDYLAEPAVSENALHKIPKNLLTLIKYEKNYHENFNELNREETFAKIEEWIQKVLL